ncbi:MAG: SDR family NAD(P)-dependent oxidoreductase [Pseudomonadota bacterium]
MHVLITGANRGIGAGLAAHYEARGETVTATARSSEAETWLDVTVPDSLAAFAAQFESGSIDLLICNAGVYLDRTETLDAGFPVQAWAETFATNVTGVFLTVQALLPALRRAGGAKIAVISSQMGSHARAKGNSFIYRASKAAVSNLGCNLAIALQRDGIAVGTYHPGWVRTDMGGAAADVSVEEAVVGLARRFDALGMQTTGCFEAFDGTPIPY